MDYFKEAVRAQPDERAWVTYIKAKVTEQNQSFPTLVVGQTGSGKSWSTLRLCEEIEPDFKLEGNWFFRAGEFFKEFSNFYKDKRQKAKIWVLDEAGVDFASDEWQSKINKVFAKVFSTARFRNYIFFGTVPFTDFISKKIRKLMQYRFTANYTQNIGGKVRGILVPRCLQWSERKEDFYYHRLVKIMPNGEESDINRLLMKKPSKKIREQYEKIRAEFSDDLNEELLQELDDMTPKKVLPEQYTKVVQGVKDGKTGQEQAEELKVSHQRIREIKMMLRKRGYDFTYNKDGNRIYNPDTSEWEFYPKKQKI